jgi:putative transposase
MPYWNLYYHLIWATHEREPLIGRDEQSVIKTILYRKAQELGVTLYGVGNVADHVHVAASIPPSMSVATCIKHLKGASSRAVNLQVPPRNVFRWQEGYGALTFAELSLDTVVAYIRDQPRHHHLGTTLAFYETTDARPQSSSDDLVPP